jgi:hypothetical protein
MVERGTLNQSHRVFSNLAFEASAPSSDLYKILLGKSTYSLLSPIKTPIGRYASTSPVEYLRCRTMAFVYGVSAEPLEPRRTVEHGTENPAAEFVYSTPCLPRSAPRVTSEAPILVSYPYIGWCRRCYTFPWPSSRLEWSSKGRHLMQEEPMSEQSELDRQPA